MANNHHEAILLLDEPTLRHTDEEVTTESLSQHPWAANMSRWCRCCNWPYRWVWDDNLWTVSLQNNTSDNELQFPVHLFLKTEAECVDELPHDINGFKLYKIKCSPQEWVQKSQDLRSFKMNTSKKGANRDKESWEMPQKSVLHVYWLPI